MDIHTLLADPEAIRLEYFVSESRSITLFVQSKQSEPCCPQCQQPSTSLHSHYRRTLAGLPWHGIIVKLELRSRKFRCQNNRCLQKVFCERLPNVATAYARKTVRLRQALSVLAFALGGEAGARAAARLGLIVSGDTLLRQIRRTTFATPATARVLGVDDWAKRKGMRYGTVLVDLERRQVIDLLPERSAECVKEWLLKHPGVEVVSRDRASSYADAVREAAPQSQQVADRFHLCKNLTDVIERLLTRQYAVVRQVVERAEAKEQEELSTALSRALEFSAETEAAGWAAKSNSAMRF